MRKDYTKLREWWRFYQRKEHNSLKSIGVTLNILMSRRFCSISWWIQIFSRISVMSQFRDANYAKVFRCRRWLVYWMRMQIWFGFRLFWTTRVHFLTKMRKLHPKSRGREWLRLSLRAARRNSWPSNLVSNLILRFCRFLMLRRCIQVWKSYKLLSVSQIISKHLNMYSWRDTKRLQVMELWQDFKMKILSSKSRSEEGSKRKCLSINKKKDLLSMKVFMKILSLLRNSQRCVALKFDTCLWILFS